MIKESATEISVQTIGNANNGLAQITRGRILLEVWGLDIGQWVVLRVCAISLVI